LAEVEFEETIRTSDSWGSPNYADVVVG
jgi:hypothetical protein